MRYTAELSGVDELALSLLDVLTGLDELKVCVGYRRDGKDLEQFDPSGLEGVECVYETLPGWSEDITGCRSFEELPEAARRYVEAVSRWVGRPVCFVSVGPGREAFIVHGSQIEGV